MKKMNPVDAAKKVECNILFGIVTAAVVLWSGSVLASSGPVINCDSLFEDPKEDDPIEKMLESQGPMDLSFLKKYKMTVAEKLTQTSSKELPLDKRRKGYDAHLVELASTEFYDDRVPKEFDFVHRLSHLDPQQRVLAFGFDTDKGLQQMKLNPEQFALSNLQDSDMMTFGKQDLKFILTQYMLNPGDDRLNNAMFNSYLNQASAMKRFLQKPLNQRPEMSAILRSKLVSSGQYETQKPNLQMKDVPEYDLGYTSAWMGRDPDFMRTLSLLVQKMKVGGVLYVTGSSDVLIDSLKYPVNKAKHQSGDIFSLWLQKHAQGLQIINPSHFFFIIHKTSAQWSLPDAVYNPEKTAEASYRSLILRPTGKGIVSE